MIRVQSRVSFSEHRSGWNFVMDLLARASSDAGVLLVDFVESFWGWNLPPASGTKEIFFDGQSHSVPCDTLRISDGVTHALLPDGRAVRYVSGDWEPADPAEHAALLPPGVIREPFVCVLHNPPDTPRWFDYENNPREITAKKQFIDALRYCEGIYVFSEYLRDWVLNNVGVPCPVNVLTHPTEEPDATWQLHKFLAGAPTVVQVGYWLRRLHAIYTIALPPHYRRVWLYGNQRAFDLLVEEARHEGVAGHADARVEALRLGNREYDDLLSRSLALVDLYDSSCNNAIIECVVRHTPVLVRRLPPTEEYLGRDYPLFFDDLGQAAALARDIVRIRQAHAHMQRLHRSGRFSGDTFIADLRASFIHRKLAGIPPLRPRACISLGVDCFPRAMLTKFGYKRRKADGERTMPFDLAYHPPHTVLDMLGNDFEGCWDRADLYVNQDGIIMHRNGSMYNHESDTPEKLGRFSADGFAELRRRYLARAANLRHAVRHAALLDETVLFVNVGTEYPARLRDAVRLLCPGLRFHLLTLNLLWHGSDYRDTLPNVEFGSPEAEANGFSFYSIRRPYEGYTWYDAADFSSPAGRDFEAQVDAVLSRVAARLPGRDGDPDPTSDFLDPP